MWTKALWEKLNFYFQEIFANTDKMFTFGGNISMMFWGFPDISQFPKSISLSRLANRKAIHIYQFIANNNASFHWWWKENLLSHQKVSKYYKCDCLQNFPLLFMSLLATLIVKKVIFWLEFTLYFFWPNLKSFQYQIWTSLKRSGK